MRSGSSPRSVSLTRAWRTASPPSRGGASTGCVPFPSSRPLRTSPAEKSSRSHVRHAATWAAAAASASPGCKRLSALWLAASLLFQEAAGTASRPLPVCISPLKQREELKLESVFVASGLVTSESVTRTSMKSFM